MRRILAGLVVAVTLLGGGAGPAFAYHDDRGGGGYDDGGDCDWEGNCGGQSYDDQWSNEDRNRNRNRNRGAFSPGPFDRSPIEMHDVCISLDCSGRDKDKKDQPPKKQRAQSVGCMVPLPYHCDPTPASLFPPSPDALRQFVVQTVKAGIEMGRLFADTTITFVTNLMTGIA